MSAARLASSLATLDLSLHVTRNARTEPLILDQVQAEGITFRTSVGLPGDVFWRQLMFGEFDVSEMSMASLLMSIDRGDDRWVALPVFTEREFFHTHPVVTEASGIISPKDLHGKRVGVTEYQQTAAVWARGVLMQEFDVDPRKMEWFMERSPEKSHGGAIGFRAPAGVSITYMAPDQSVASMMLDGTLDAAIRYSVFPGSFLNKGHAELRGQVGIRSLFPDPIEEGVRFFRKTGILPMNHCVVLRRQIFESHPWSALNVYLAFAEANRIASVRARDALLTYERLGLVCVDPKAAASETIPYGILANYDAIERLLSYLHEQGLTSRRLAVDEVFASTTLSF